MWVLSEQPILRLWSILRRFPIQAAAITAAFLWIAGVNQPVYAADATWENGTISYQNKSYSGPKTAPANSPLGVMDGAKYYEHTEGNLTSIIYFPAEADTATAQGARYAEFTVTPPDKYTPRGQSKSISIEARSDAKDDANEQENKEVTSCAVNGIGYILCPIMTYIADAMDKIFDFLRNFLEVRPLATEKESSLHRAWSYMQSFANIAFVLVFLILIYSQVTSQGVNNYNIKRTIPRLIVAALLVNVSYYICVILVDVSNILGASLQDILMQVRTEIIQGQGENKLDSLSWGELTAYLLSGGTIIGAGLVGLSGAGTGVVYLLVPVLVSALLAVFVAVAILAARQALITILVILSPLAFVAFVLPGTQKYFDRWRSTFQTMLLLYPIFSILFGGAQLAGYLIAQNADRPEVLLLAMFVQLAPLIITPFLIKFSGGVLGKIAGMINNPTKGVGDRAKNWASGKHDLAKARRIADHSFGSGVARQLDSNRRRDEALKKRYEGRRSRRFNNSAIGRSLSIEQMREDDKIKGTDAMNEATYHTMRVKNQAVRSEAIETKLAEMKRDTAQQQSEVFINELKTEAGGKAFDGIDPSIVTASRQFQRQSRKQHVLGSRAAMATMADRGDYSNAMMNSKQLQQDAAGVMGEHGQMLAAANAVVEMRQDFGKGASAVAEIMQHVRMSGSDVNKLAMREDVVDLGGFTFDFKDDHVHEAAVEKLLTEKGNMDQKLNLVARSSEQEFEGVRTTISSAAAKSMTSGVPFLGGKPLDDIATTGVSRQDFGAFVRQYVKKGKANQAALVSADELALKEMVTALVDHENDFTGIAPADRQTFIDNRAKLFEAATEALHNPRLQESIKENARESLEKLSSMDVNAQLGGKKRP